MALRKLFASLLLLATHVAAETRTFDWNITWVARNPDGMHSRPVIGINNEWPLPTVNITKGDRVIVNMNNQVCDATIASIAHPLTAITARQSKHEYPLPRPVPEWHQRDGRPSWCHSM